MTKLIVQSRSSVHNCTYRIIKSSDNFTTDRSKLSKWYTRWRGNSQPRGNYFHRGRSFDDSAEINFKRRADSALDSIRVTNRNMGRNECSPGYRRPVEIPEREKNLHSVTKKKKKKKERNKKQKKKESRKIREKKNLHFSLVIRVARVRAGTRRTTREHCDEVEGISSGVWPIETR